MGDGNWRTDVDKPAGRSETAMLMLPFTLLQRSVLDIAPGFLLLRGRRLRLGRRQGEVASRGDDNRHGAWRLTDPLLLASL